MPLDLRQLFAGQTRAHGRYPAAVVTMELQRGVVGDLSSFPELAAAAAEVGAVDNTARLLTSARAAGIPVVHCTAEFRPDRLGTVANTPLHSAVLGRPEHLLAGSAAVELTPRLGAEPGDLVSSRRHGVSPFTGTTLDVTLRNVGAQVLVVAGVSVNLGVLGMCVEAVNLGYQVALPVDAVAGVPSDYATQVLRHSLSLVATLTTVDEVCALWGEGPP